MRTMDVQQQMFSPPSVSHLVAGTSECPILVGTSGYSYTEWSDCGFYPASTRTADMLGLYMRFFPVVELNYTWYQMPKAEAVSRMIRKVPEDFLFAAKLTRSLTHERDENWQQLLRQYRRGIAPLRSRLVAVLVQLPPDFDRSTGNRYYLAQLLDGLQDFTVAVEFRHASWAAEKVYQELARRRVTLVGVDCPPLAELFPPLDIVTNPDLFYLRFHGRNAAGWHSSNMQKKFDYDYSTEELLQWARGKIGRISAASSRGVIFFNNHVRAQAPRNAREMQRILKSCM